MNSFRLSKLEIDRLKGMTPTIDELRVVDLMRDYRAVRKAYFGSSIPPVEEVLIRFLPAYELARFCPGHDPDTEGACLAGKYGKDLFPYVLVLANDLNVRDTRFTLLHEMAHMKVNKKFGRKMGEGKHWKKEMRRLMAAGALDGWM
jgi:hypothetical protein